MQQTLENTTQNIQSDNLDYSPTASVFLIAVIVCLVLVSIIIIQSRKITEMSRPKFGFLGKPLMLILTFALGFFSIGLTLIVNRDSGVTVINADLKAELHVFYTKITDKVYKFNAVPVVESLEWAGKKFDFYWVLTNSQTLTYFEYELSADNLGGIILNLENGKNSIKASTFVDGRLIEKEIVINL